MIPKSHGGGRAHRAKMHFAPRHREPVVNIATSRFGGNRPDGSHRPANVFLAQDSAQNLSRFRHSRVVQSVSLSLALSRLGDERCVFGECPAESRCFQAAFYRRCRESDAARTMASTTVGKGNIMRRPIDPDICIHKPACPSQVTRWACGQRTRTEDAVNRGLITREAGRSLLAKYGCPMTPVSRVYRGEPPATPHQEKLV